MTLPQLCRYCLLWDKVIIDGIRTMPYLEVWAREDVCARKGMDCRDSKGGSCNPWGCAPTSPREAHEDVLIRSDLPLTCKVLSSTIVCFGDEEQNHEGYGPQSGQYLHS